MTHLHDVHNISRRTTPSEFADYIKQLLNPTCVCGCGKCVKLHNRKLQYNLFAIDCANKSKYCNPACLEFHLFNGKSASEAIAAVRIVQSKVITEKHRQSLMAVNSGDNNPMSLVRITKRFDGDVDKAHKFISDTNSGTKNGFYGKKHTNATLQRIANTRSKQWRYVTKPELVVWGMLHGLGKKFKYQVPIDRYLADFVIGTTIIEVFGDYWHSASFLPANTNRDNKKIPDYIKNGYDVLIIWESEVFLEPENVVAKLSKL